MARFDLHFQALPVAEQTNTYKFVSFGFNPAIAVRGLQMLVNQWLKCLLTPRGSDPTDLNYGTDFTKLIGSNLDLRDARDVTALAIETCSEQITEMQNKDPTLTTTERLANATITNFVEDASLPGFQAYVEIKNQANERLVLNLPATAVTE